MPKSSSVNKKLQQAGTARALSHWFMSFLSRKAFLIARKAGTDLLEEANHLLLLIIAFILNPLPRIIMAKNLLVEHFIHVIIRKDKIERIYHERSILKGYK